MSLIKKERLPQLEVYRALAILAVLNVHASSFAAGVQAKSSSFYYVYNFMNIFSQYGTSSFIFLSGFVLFYNYYERPVTVKLLSRFYRQRLISIVVPYTFVSLCYFLVAKYINQQLIGVPFSELWVSFRNAWLTGTAYVHLYYVFISVQFYILFPFMLKLLQSKRWIVKWIIPIALALQWGFVFYNKYSLHVINKGSYSITYLAVFMMGAYLAINFERIKPWLMNTWDLLSKGQRIWTIMLWSSWLVVALIYIQLYHNMRSTGSTVNSLWYELNWNVHSMLSALVLMHATFLIYRKASRKVLAFLTRMGELSFAIYLLHPIILAQYRNFRYNIAPESITYFGFIIGGLLVSLFLSWAIIHFCFKKLPFSWVFLGSIPSSLSQKDKKHDTQVKEHNNSLNS